MRPLFGGRGGDAAWPGRFAPVCGKGNVRWPLRPARWCMDTTNRFSYRSARELRKDIARRGLDLPAINLLSRQAGLPVREGLSVLATGVSFGRLTIANRLVVQPMEGCDGTADGAPTELTVRRYRRFAAGGAGMIWVEATAVVAEGRANPRQLWLHEGTVDAFADMLRQAKAAASRAGGSEPVFVLQLTHSGRYSRPVGPAKPIIAHHSPILDPTHDLPGDYPLISDERLDALQDDFARAAALAAQAGFDAVDIKSCHRYLLSELLASFTRENSRYGGPFENRTRMLRETAAKVRGAVGDRIEITTRLNVHDAIEYPYGWGMSPDDPKAADLSEPVRLVGELARDGFGVVNVTIGNPYFNPHVNRPADWPIADWPGPPEHPLDGVARIVHAAREIQQAAPDITVVGSGLTWLRHYMPQFAAAFVSRGWMGMVGLGRGALAYPDFARDILDRGEMDRHKVCVVCSSCTQIMRDGGRGGCVVRDHEVYAPIFREGRRRDPAVMRQAASLCRGCADAMCVAACPAGVDIPGFMGLLADGREKDAYDLLRARNALPGICGAVCPVEVQCQSACIRNMLADGPVRIGEIQKNLSLKAVTEGWAGIDVPSDCTGRRIAIVGAGPAGLAAAAELLARGHRVEILDPAPRPGGKLEGVIPPDRLPPELARAEIDAVFDSVPPDRLTWRLGTGLSEAHALDDLMAEGFDAAILAFGLADTAGPAGQRRPEGVMEAGAFLRRMNANPEHPAPASVAVIGGGNTALDAAVCAQQHGARDTYVVYRRGYQQMPAWPDQREQVLRAGVHLLLLCQPVGYVADEDGRVAGLRVVRTQLGEPDDSDRRRPVEVPGSEFVLAVDMVVEAIGEAIDPNVRKALGGIELTADGLVAADPVTLDTSRPGVWAAGDLVNGGATVVQAVAEGLRAARLIDDYVARQKK